jgi:hypothetical protein
MGGASPEIVEQLKQSWGSTAVSRTARQLLVAARRTATSASPRISTCRQRARARPHPVTVLLVFSALLLAMLGWHALGVASARRPGSAAGAVTSMVALLGFSAPVFWSGLMLIMLFSLAIPLFPASGYFDVARNASGLEHLIDVAWHLVLPAFTLASVYLAIYARLARATMMEVLGADYVRTCTGEGLSETIVVWKHALRNAVLPSVTMAGLQFSSMLAGAVLSRRSSTGRPRPARLRIDPAPRQPAAARHPVLLGALRHRRQPADRPRLPDRGSADQDRLKRMSASSEAVPATPARSARPWSEAWREYRRNGAAIAGLVVVVAIATDGADRSARLSGRSVRHRRRAADAAAGQRQSTGHRRARPRHPRRAAARRQADTDRRLRRGADHGADRDDARNAGRIFRRQGRRDDFARDEFFQTLPALLFAMVIVTLFGATLTTVTLAIGAVS